MQISARKNLSRARQGLRRIHEQIENLLDIFMDRKPMTKGTVYEMKRKCGKPGCRCATGELHASMVLSWSEDGSTRIRTIPKGKLTEVRSLTERYQKFRRARARLIKLQLEMIALIDKIDTARRKKV